MKPEDLKPEDRDRLRELATLKVLWELLAAAKKNLDIVTWRREGFPEAEDFLHALESGGLHPLLEKWQELRRTIAANRPVPDPLDSNARRLTVRNPIPHRTWRGGSTREDSRGGEADISEESQAP